ncbi:MAG: aminoacyl-tRNA hydrolase [Myxococcales bacterium 68-20]|nr:aminoacyl-tRNA hydrolase [Myxococcales bacterium]OJY31602.1 MAG: aminoacyl-tRNA hydrolase [Myxococcales bacterium 68-20]
MSSPLVINDKVTLPGSDLEWTAVRSSGPGGQNVNKVASKVELSFDFENTVALSDSVRDRLRILAKNQLDAEGRVLLKSEKTRDQTKNLADARQKLKDLVLEAMVVPKTRKPTKVSKAQKARRLSNKKKVGAKKAARKKPQRDD